MVMAEKSFPEMLWDDVKKVLGRGEAPEAEGKPGSELPGYGKCGCHPGGIHSVVEVVEAEQRDPVELVAIPTEVRNIVRVMTVPAKRGSIRRRVRHGRVSMRIFGVWL